MKLIMLLLRVLLLAVTFVYLAFAILTLWTWGELGTYVYIPIYTFIFGQFTSAMILVFMSGFRYFFGERKLSFKMAESRIFMTSFIALLIYMLSVLITWKT